MRTNIDIDDDLMDAALKAGPFKTKKEAVEAGLKLLARQAAYREILKWKGKLKWEGDESIDWTQPRAEDSDPEVSDPTPEVTPKPAHAPASKSRAAAEALAAHEPEMPYAPKKARRAGR